MGALLLVLAAALWRLTVSVRDLAAGNVLTAAAAVTWPALASGFSPAGAALLAATAAALAVPAAVQAATLRR